MLPWAVGLLLAAARAAPPATRLGGYAGQPDHYWLYPLAPRLAGTLEDHAAAVAALPLQEENGTSRRGARRALRAPVRYHAKAGSSATADSGAAARTTSPPGLGNIQPLDLLLGSSITGPFHSAAPPATPPPAEFLAEITDACPILVNFPASVRVGAPTGCSGARLGKWSQVAGEEILAWEEGCSLKSSLFPMLAYTTPTNATFGYSTAAVSLSGSFLELRDCKFRLLYTVHEKVYHDTSLINQVLCKRYGSCATGHTLAQYFIYDRLGKKIAETGYLTLFQSSWEVLDTEGGRIAKVERVGRWKPQEACSNRQKLWHLAYETEARSILTHPLHRWPVAMLVTMMSTRDLDRTSSGVVWPMPCSSFALAFVAVGLVGAVAILAAVLVYTRAFWPAAKRFIAP